MALEIDGKVAVILDTVSGTTARGEWKKRDFVIETSGEYPKKVVFSGWGERVDTIGTLNEGDQVKVSFEPESREYQGRYYTDLRAYKISKLDGSAASSSNNNSSNQGSNNNSFQETQNNSAPAGDQNFAADDDLPF